ncbi:MAG: lipopolysaccharide biosynthesis protein [Candidatus Sigynarchaeum springense]
MTTRSLQAHESGTATPAQSNTIDIAVITSRSSSKYLLTWPVALDLDPAFNITYFTDVNMSAFAIQDPASHSQPFDVVYMLDLPWNTTLTIGQVQNLTWAVENGTAGLFFQANSASMVYNQTLLSIIDDVLPLRPVLDGSGFPKEIRQNVTDTIGTIVSPGNDILQDRIGFISLPQLLNLTETVASHPSAKMLVEGSRGLTVGSQRFPMLATLSDPSVRVVELAAPVRAGSNKNLGNWPYWTYFVYVSTMKLAGKVPGDVVQFADWPFAPIPQASSKAFILLLLGSFAAITVVMFLYFRKYTRSTPLELVPVEIYLQRVAERKAKEATKKKLFERLVNRGKKPALPAKETPVLETIGSEKSWELPGYHKPLAGFFVMFFITLVVVAPLFVIIIYILPTFIIQDPGSFGIQFIISSIFSAVFITLDFGLAQAYDRFVGQYWTTDPARALRYVQLFIWYQMISGLVQTTAISLIGVYLVPRVASIGFMSYFFVVNSLVQFPGIVYVFTHLLKSAQRTDLEALVNFLSLLFFQIGLMAVLPEIFRNIGARNPLIGEVIGSSLGLSIASYAGSLAQMLLSAAFLKKIDARFTVKQMFRLDFDWRLVRETLVFGLKSMLSNVIYLFGNFASVLIITLFLNNYTYLGSFIGIATYLTYPILFMTVLYENALPTTSEAYNNKKVKLAEAFVSYGFKYFGTFALLLFTLFVMPFSVNRIVTSVVPELYKPMGMVIMLYSITKLFIALGDFAKFFLIAIDRAGTYVVAVAIEQVIRITFLLSTIGSLQFFAFVFAEIPGVIFKVIFTWILTDKRIIKVRVNWWQTIVAPGFSCLAIAGLSWLLSLSYDSVLAALTPVGGAMVYMVVFFFGFGNFLYPFLIGLFGGHDTESLAQIEFAARHAGPSKPFALVFYRITALGSRLSPFHGKHPIPYDEAAKEASELFSLVTGRS